MFNNNDVQLANSQKHLGLVLDSKLDFNEHVNNKIYKCNIFMGIMKKLSSTLSRNCLLTIYKTFIRPILDYVDVIYDKPVIEFFIDKLHMVQYNTALVSTGAIKSNNLVVNQKNLKQLPARTKIFERLFFLIVLKSGIILVRSF